MQGDFHACFKRRAGLDIAASLQFPKQLLQTRDDLRRGIDFEAA
jgi:hypothetical protein